jgi:hypothetical protein
MTTSEALAACPGLQVKMEGGENVMFGLCEELLRAQELYLAVKIDYLSKGKEDVASKIAMTNCKCILTQLRQPKLNCEQDIKCTENTIEFRDMAQAGIVAESRNAHETIMLEAN